MTRTSNENRAPNAEYRELTAIELETVSGGRTARAQSDVSAKYSQTHDAIAQNFK
jgi:hypothetical protein